MEGTCSNKKEQILPQDTYCEAGSFSHDDTTLLFPDARKKKRKKNYHLRESLFHSFPLPFVFLLIHGH